MCGFAFSCACARVCACVCACVENALRSLLEALTSPPYAPMQHLEREQALAKQFAEILHFTLSFDELKVQNQPEENHLQEHLKVLRATFKSYHFRAIG